MEESLLSFSNIDLFGQAIGEIKLVNPDRPIKVQAATTSHEKYASLSGLRSIDDVPLTAGSKVLVWKQLFPWMNGIYTVKAGKWKFREGKASLGEYVFVTGGTANVNLKTRLVSSYEIVRTTATIVIPAKTTAANTSSLQITINGADLLVTIPTLPANATPAQIDTFRSALVDEINKETNAPYFSENVNNSVAIYCPTGLSEAAIGYPITFTLDNFDAIPETKFKSSGLPESAEETVRHFDTVLSGKGLRKRRYGENNQLDKQILKDSCFARIYGFSYEGTYYDLSRPVLFLVHGPGELVTTDLPQNVMSPQGSRAPGATTLTGLAAADFDFADSLRVWSYDKADYTIRMDVETGMFEDVLLAAMLGGGPGGMEAAGMSARGMSARGMSARGMSARGMSARGMSARGGGGNGD